MSAVEEFAAATKEDESRPGPKRPALRWFGGKWKLAPWIIQHLPPHRIYVEPFGGAASILLRKPRSYAEVYNDLDGEIVSFFRVLRNPSSAAALVEAVELTPFARDELHGAYALTSDPVEQARCLLVRSYMGFGSGSAMTLKSGANSTGFRNNSNRSGTTPAHDWRNYPGAMVALIDRLRGVVIENRDAIDVVRQHDRPDVLHYVDPPYVHSTRSLRNRYCKKSRYRHEMDDAAHAELLRSLNDLKGMVAVSGYASPLYETHLSGWQRFETQTFGDAARPRTEVLWLNPAADRALDAARMPLFDRRYAP